MISYGVCVGATGARRTKDGHGDILTYYFSILQPILAESPFNMIALSRQTPANFLDHPDKLPRNCVHTFHELSYHFQSLQFYSSGTSFLDTTFFVFRSHLSL